VPHTARSPLTRDSVLQTAMDIADAEGLKAVSMRRVAGELGVEAMSLYHHIPGKEQLLDELVDWLFRRVELPAIGTGWRDGMRERARSARSVFTAHPWGLTLAESRRTAGPALLEHHDAVLGCLRRDGFSVALAAHAFAVLDSYVYGFVLTEQRLPFEADERVEDFAAEIDLPAERYPYMAEMVGELVIGRDYAFGDEFEHGLDLILDGLAARLSIEPGQPSG
jgi:AcrR family transcriptional regulator